MSLLCQALSAPRPFMLPGQQRRLHGLFQPHPCPPLLDYLWLGLAPPLAALLPFQLGTGAAVGQRLHCRHFGNVDIFINYNLQVVWAPYQLLLSSGVELIILPQARSLLLLFILLQVLLELDRLQMGQRRCG